VLVRGDSQLGLSSSKWRSGFRWVASPLALRVFDAALYVGQRSRDYFLHYGFPAERLFHSPHCVDTAWFASRATVAAGGALREQVGITSGEKVALFAGKLVEFKRPLDLVDAAGELASQGRPVTVMVAGAGPLEDAMRQRARERGIRFVMLGFRNQTEMPACYAACDVLVLPSTRRETWGLVANEALACGRPIVVSAAAGCAPDLAADGVTGRVYPVGNIPRLAVAIAVLLKEPPSLSSFQNQSKLFSVDCACKGILAGVDRSMKREPSGFNRRWD
jgi:glycosyltransferase involved in cell wall biosynthesis